MVTFNRTDYAANTSPIGVVIADVDGDGDQDVIVANPGVDPSSVNPASGNQISVLRNNGDGTFAVPVSFTTGVRPSVTAGDFDGDGDIDLATANSTDDTVSLLRNDGLGNFTAPVSFTTGDRPSISTPSDLDGDGDLDLITVNTVDTNLNTGIDIGDTISILRNNGSGAFAAPETLTVGEGVSAARTADLDRDGDLDIVTANEGEDTLSVLRNNGNGTFAAPVELEVGDRPVRVVTADFDGDGDLDLATPNFGGSNVSVLKNNGDGTFATQQLFETPSSPSSLIAADLDGDGDLDLAMQHAVFYSHRETSGSTISVLTNNGDGTFAAPTELEVGNTPAGLSVADLDRNGLPDLVTSNFDSNSVTVYLTTRTSNGTGRSETLRGDAGPDLLLGKGGDDKLLGAAGEDTLLGGTGEDTLNGGVGDDFLNGGSKDDVLIGGAGRDTCVIKRGRDVDTIRRFQDGQDLLSTSVGFRSIALEREDNRTILSVGNDVLAVMVGVRPNQITRPTLPSDIAALLVQE